MTIEHLKPVNRKKAPKSPKSPKSPKKKDNAYVNTKKPLVPAHKSTLARKQSYSFPRNLGSLRRSPLRENLSHIHRDSQTESDSETSLSDDEAYPQGTNKENRLMGNYGTLNYFLVQYS